MSSITPWLWFDTEAEEAATFWTELFPNSRIVEVTRYGHGWCKGRFGVSWQIVPKALPALLGDPDPGRAQRAMQAMLGMKKLDIAALQAAADS